jgi:hypothetical protein
MGAGKHFTTHGYCRLALAEAPTRCDGGWFEAWRRPLADLCAGHADGL